jgi:hypothetical protein
MLPAGRLFTDGVYVVGHDLFEGEPLLALGALALSGVGLLSLLSALNFGEAGAAFGAPAPHFAGSGY